MKLVESDPLLDTREMQRVAGERIIRESFFGRRAVNQLDLVDDNARIEVVACGNYKKIGRSSRRCVRNEPA